MQQSSIDRNALADPQNGNAETIVGSNTPIVQVGISSFRLPLRVPSSSGTHSVDTRVTGTVSLDRDKRGINMSRVLRTFYDYADRSITPEALEEILLAYKDRLGSTRARLRLEFAYPIRVPSLRSGMTGWQYYDVAYEGSIDDLGHFRRRIEFDFVYSSACPCAAELSEQSREATGIPAVPHSQRSRARIWAEVRPGHILTIEDLQALCQRALRTETQVMVRREDEQAFAELNAEHLKFVEDAVRLLHEVLEPHPAIADFQVATGHLESLHSHDAVAVLTKGIKGGFTGEGIDFRSLRDRP